MKHIEKAGCPYETGDIVGQIKMEQQIAEWKKKNKTPYDSMVNSIIDLTEYKRSVELSTNNVVISPLQKGCTGLVIVLTVPDSNMLTMPGIDESDESIFGDYGFNIRAMDADKKEVDSNTVIRVRGFIPQTQYQSLLEPPHFLLYKQVSGNQLFRFKHSFIIKSGQQIQWIFENPNRDIVNVEFMIKVDLWEKEYTEVKQCQQK